MSAMEPENPAKVSRSLPSLILRGLLLGIIAFVVLVLLAFIDGLFVLQAVYALVTGWILHGIRVLPGFFANWQAAIVPLAALVLAWLAAHRLMRWWLATRKLETAQGWTMWRTSALLGLVLLCGAAAVAISGVTHQAMWLGQTKWTQSNRNFELTQMLNNTRQLLILVFEFDDEHHRQPHSWEELVYWDKGQSTDSIMHSMIGRGKGNAMPVLTRPGAGLRGMNPATVLIVTDQVGGFHVVGRADIGVTRITPQQLDAMIARGDWLLTD